MQGFISYSHEDYDDFKSLETHLRQITAGAGFHFWCDERISIGYDWHARILNEIGKSTAFLVLASPREAASGLRLQRFGQPSTRARTPPWGTRRAPQRIAQPIKAEHRSLRNPTTNSNVPRYFLTALSFPRLGK